MCWNATLVCQIQFYFHFKSSATRSTPVAWILVKVYSSAAAKTRFAHERFHYVYDLCATCTSIVMLLIFQTENSTQNSQQAVRHEEKLVFYSLKKLVIQQYLTISRVYVGVIDSFEWCFYQGKINNFFFTRLKRC